jgi:hypothetical protein
MGAVLLAVPLSKNAEAWESRKLSIHMTKVADCEDTGKPVCYTYDEGEWRIVTSYNPYKAKSVKLCTKKGAGCLIGKGSVRTYIWKG